MLEWRNGDLESGLKGPSSQFERLRGIKQALRSCISNLELTNQDLDEELTSLKKDVIGQHERGFQKAVRQAKLFAADLDVDRFDPLKDVKDEALVDEEEVLPVGGSEDEDGRE